MVSESQIIALSKSIPNKFGAQHVEKLNSESDWDIKSCRWFISQLKSDIKMFLIGTVGVPLLDLSELGVSRFAPLGSKRQLKKMDKIMAEMGEFTGDKEYKDIADNYITYIAYSVVSFYIKGDPDLLTRFANSQHFVPSLKAYTDMLFNEGGDGQEEDDEEVWDPYSVQKWILLKMKEQNDQIIKENKESEEDDKELLVIPKEFDILKDREKISPV